MHSVHSIRSAEAVIELCVRIWWELEYLAQLCDRTETRDNSKLPLAAATLRLELLVILDSCESCSWASMLIGDERQNLYSMLSEVLEAIARSPDDLRAGHIECAQDRLFDEVMRQYAAVSACGLAA